VTAVGTVHRYLTRIADRERIFLSR
jgi:hypothetical protein